jgi:NAD(P)-dependent dehydrogenase (short-subunit alcohol dehydrogenase family)
MLITGANRGLGRALLDEALQRGAARIFAGTRKPQPAVDPRVTWLELDVTSDAQVDAAAAAVAQLDVLVNNAGLGLFDRLDDLGAVQKHFEINCLGMLRVTKAFVPALRRARGAVVNHLSLASLASVPMMQAYSISKAAMLNATQGLRAQLAPRKISVHAVVLGPLDTEMSASLTVPRADPRFVAAKLLDGLARGEADLFPDPAAAPLAQPWAQGVAKQLEAQFASFVPPQPSFTLAFTVPQSPREVFDAITNVAGWWSDRIDGPTATLGAEYVFWHRDLHRSTQRTTELVRDRRLVWRVTRSELSFLKERAAWDGHELVFDVEPGPRGTTVRFTHDGLTPDCECYAACAPAWTHYVNGSLRSLITTGTGDPERT